MQVALIKEPRGERHFRKRDSRTDQAACQRDTLLKHIGVRREAELARESSQ